MRHVAAALVLASGLVLTACSSDDTETGTDAGSGTAPSSAAASSDPVATPPSTSADPGTDEAGGADDVPPGDVKGLALTAADFPAPYTFMELPPGALESGAAATGGLLADATFEPAECGSAAKLGQEGDISKAGVALATDSATSATVVSVLTPATSPTSDLGELADTCSSFTFSVKGPDGTPLDGKAELELLPTPSVDADRAQAARTTVTVSAGGKQQTVVTTVYGATLRGVAVAATGTATTDAPIDDAVLEELLGTAVAKVAAY